MLQIKSPKSSVKSSKRLNRRFRISADVAKKNTKRFFPILLIILAVFLLNNLFIIRKVNCTYNDEVCPKETQIVINQLVGTNSLFINQKELLVFIKAVYPVDKMAVGYQAFNTLNIKLKGSRPNIEVDVYLVSNLPALSMDQAPSTTDSAGWWVKPTGELDKFISSQKALGFNLWENGAMTSIATTGANISFIFTEKPTPETVSSVYKMVKIILKYIDVSNIYIVNRRSFLSRTGQPDIIVSIPTSEDSLIASLQSINYLATIKKDIKVIDFSFKNPILR